MFTNTIENSAKVILLVDHAQCLTQDLWMTWFCAVLLTYHTELWWANPVGWPSCPVFNPGLVNDYSVWVVLLIYHTELGQTNRVGWPSHPVFNLCSCEWQSSLRPFLVDPSSRATEWLKVHMKDSRLEVINQQVMCSLCLLCHWSLVSFCLIFLLFLIFRLPPVFFYSLFLFWLC